MHVLGTNSSIYFFASFLHGRWGSALNGKNFLFEGSTFKGRNLLSSRSKFLLLRFGPFMEGILASGKQT